MRAAVLMPCWKSPELLRVSIPSLKKTIGVDDMLIVILNEVDAESMRIVVDENVAYIAVSENHGPSAVDLAIPMMNDIGFEYVINVNSDMLFSNGWVDELISLLEDNYPCSTSASLVEPQTGGGHALEQGIDFFDPLAHDSFNQFVANNKYRVGISHTHYGHPILVRMDDFLKVNGYSDNMDPNWIEARGRALDDWFAFRLKALHPNFKFINSNKAFVYHAVSLNTRKVAMPNPGMGAQYFQTKTSLTPKQFYDSL